MRYVALVVALLATAALLVGPIGPSATSTTAGPITVAGPPTDDRARPWRARRLAVSRDGRHFRESLKRPLFPSGIRWVPGDVRRDSFYVRHLRGRPREVHLTLRRIGAGHVLRSGRGVVRVQADGGSWTRLVPGREVLLVEGLGPRRVVRVGLEARLRPRVRHAMDRPGHIRLHLRTGLPGASPLGGSDG